MIPKYVLYSFLLLQILTIPLTKIPFHPMVEIQAVLYTILGAYPLCVFLKNYKYLKDNCKFLTYVYVLVLISCLIGLIKLYYVQSEGLLLFDIYKTYMALFSIAWIFIPIIDNLALHQVVQFCFKKVFIIWILVLLPFYRIGFTASYLEIFLPFLLFFNIASTRVKVILVLYALFFILFPGQRSNLLLFISVFIILLFKYIPLLKTKNAMRLMGWIFYFIPIICILLFIVKGFNVFDFSSYLNGEEQYGQENLFDDTRTGLYLESYNSIINHGTWMFGESPSFGYDSIWRSQYYSITSSIQRYCEVCVINIYVWYGLVGLLLFCYLFFLIIKKAFNSQSPIIITLGLYISLFYMMCWVENCNCWVSVRFIFVYLFIGFILQIKKTNMSNKGTEHYFKKMLNLNV